VYGGGVAPSEDRPTIGRKWRPLTRDDLTDITDIEVVHKVVGPGKVNDNAEFGALLRVMRNRAQLSRADAAAKLGLSVEYLRLIEAGVRTPALGQMRAFLDVYAVDGLVEHVQADGSVVDLMLSDPAGTREPWIVEFRSRIREARRKRPGDAGRDIFAVRDSQSVQPLDAGHAAELGVVVSMLTRATPDCLRRIRELLEDEFG
jgi:transcriptional regulator with XRE-family HTH domain